jgi:hypothetical protein
MYDAAVIRHKNRDKFKRNWAGFRVGRRRAASSGVSVN